MSKFFLFACLLCVAFGTSAPSFSYRSGGKEWTGGCINSTEQSPIDINVRQGVGGADSEELQVYYPVVSGWEAKLRVVHTGSAIALTARPRSLGFLMHQGHKYYVREVVFRSPSEHTLLGEQFDMEMQVVHQRNGANGNNELMIISSLFRVNQFIVNQWLNQGLLWENLPDQEGRRTLIDGPFQLGEGLLGLHSGYYRYVGTMTEPPCASGVVWNILETTQEMGTWQYRAISNLFAGSIAFAQGNGNNRPVQPLAGRGVVLHNHKQVGDGDGRAPRPIARNADPNASLTNDGLEAEPDTNAPVGNSSAVRSGTMVPPRYKSGGSDWTGACRYGRIQSPINILLSPGNPHGDFEMTTAYELSTGATIFNTGDFFRVVGYFGKIMIGEVEYEATEITIHSPAEHLIDGRQAHAEVQIYHKRKITNNRRVEPAKDDFAIISALFTENPARSSKFLQALNWDNLPGQGLKSGINERMNIYNLEGLENNEGGYYSYAGSLSFPPCTEGVKRFVLRQYQPISVVQLATLRTFFNGNNRDTQPLNGRGVVVHNVNPYKEIRNTIREVDADGQVVNA